ncbi:MAG: hypothetical protein KJ006_13115 [Thermoleophilia bacterium]|nr:hypothetical protein [Thermoleophilia bacterium]
MIAAVNGRFRDRARGQEGAISAGALILIGLALLLGYLLLAAFEGDNARFGSVPVPGEGRVELPEGDVDVYYAEGADPDSGVELIAPPDLEVTVTGPDGRNVPVSSRGAEPESTDDGMARLVGAVRASADGLYGIQAESAQATQRIRPRVTFGQGPFAAVEHRFDGVVDALRGPLGIALLVVLAVLFLLPRWRLARRRRSYEE